MDQRKSSIHNSVYLQKKNGGMHSAYNTAYANIDTELNVCIDSDDCLAPGAARKIAQAWNEMRSLGYAGMIGLDSDMQGKIIGKGFPAGLKETTHSGYYRNGGSGDKKLVFRTDIMKEYPSYPEFEGENYVGISCKFIMIDQSYKLGVLNEVLCNVEYQVDGSTNTMFRQYVKNPRGFAYFRKIMMTYPTSTKRLIIDTIHYVSSSLLSKNRRYIRESPRQFLTLLLTPLGYILTKYIKKKSTKQ